MRIDLTRGRVDVDLARDPGEVVFETIRGWEDDPNRTWFKSEGELIRGVRTQLVGVDLTRMEYRLNRATLPIRQNTIHMWTGSAESVCLDRAVETETYRRGAVTVNRARSILGVTWNLTTPMFAEQGRWALEFVSTFDDQMPAGAILRVWIEQFDPGLVFVEPEVSGRYEREEVV